MAEFRKIARETTLINSRRKGKKAGKPTFGNLLLCRAKQQPSPIDSNSQIYLNCSVDRRSMSAILNYFNKRGSVQVLLFPLASKEHAHAALSTIHKERNKNKKTKNKKIGG